MEYKETMGKRISELRKNKGMTQEQLAQRVGVTAQAVSKWENDLSCPDISILPQLAEALGVTTDELLGKVQLRSLHVIELGQGISLWSVLWPFCLTCMGVMLCKSDLSPVSLGIALFGLYMLLYNVGVIPAEYKLTWSMIWPAALILIGLTVLLGYLFPRKKEEGEGFFHVEKGDPVFEFSEEGGYVRVESAFTTETKKVTGDEPFRGAKIDMSFGSLTVDLTEANIENGATIDADVSFGSMTLRLPAFVGVKSESSAAFGGVNCPAGDPDAAIRINLKGDVSFGKIEVEYV